MLLVYFSSILSRMNIVHSITPGWLDCSPWEVSRALAKYICQFVGRCPGGLFSIGDPSSTLSMPMWSICPSSLLASSTPTSSSLPASSATTASRWISSDRFAHGCCDQGQLGKTLDLLSLLPGHRPYLWRGQECRAWHWAWVPWVPAICHRVWVWGGVLGWWIISKIQWVRFQAD